MPMPFHDWSPNNTIYWRVQIMKSSMHFSPASY
jgi:hypothetical protein